jgi:hypothetical protein
VEVPALVAIFKMTHRFFPRFPRLPFVPAFFPLHGISSISNLSAETSSINQGHLNSKRLANSSNNVSCTSQISFPRLDLLPGPLPFDLRPVLCLLEQNREISVIGIALNLYPASQFSPRPQRFKITSHQTSCVKK